ncbi:MAG: 4a-hydroxytetrahydrobiopterin dehydratase [Acidimicrobiales bacterium]
MSTPPLLDDDSIDRALVDLADWSRSGDRLVAQFIFKSFVAAFGFMTEVAFNAERLNHHPEWSNIYNRVSIELTTHDSGGLTAIDLELAQCVSKLAAAR